MAAVWIDAHAFDNADTDDHDTTHDQGLADLVADLAVPDWHADALCREYDPSWWFPTHGQTGARAEIVCSGCLVRDECEAWALEERPDAGIWAGMNARAIRARQHRVDGHHYRADVFDAVQWDVVASVLAAVGAAVAAGASAYAAWKTKEIAERDGERRDEERTEALQANLIGHFMRDGDETWLEIQNVGPATATGIGLTVDPPLLHLEPDLTPEQLRPFQMVTLPYRHIPAQANSERVTLLSWLDRAGNEQQLHVPPHPIPLSAGRSARDSMKELRKLSTELGP